MITIDNYKEYLLLLSYDRIKLILFIIILILNKEKKENKIAIIRTYFEYYKQFDEVSQNKQDLIAVIERNCISKSNSNQHRKIVKAITNIYNYDMLEEKPDNIDDYYENNTILFLNYQKELIKEELEKISDSKILLSLVFHILHDYIHTDLSKIYIEYNSFATEEFKITYLNNLITILFNLELLNGNSDLFDFLYNLIKFGETNYTYGYFINYMDKLKLYITAKIQKHSNNDIVAILYYILNTNKPDNYINEIRNIVLNINEHLYLFEKIDKTINELNDEQILDLIVKYKEYSDDIKDIKEIFGDYIEFIINEIIENVSDITEKEFLLAIIFKILHKKNSLTIVDEFEKIRNEQTEINGLIKIIDNEYLSELKGEDLINILNDIKKVKEEFSKISFNSRGSICEKKQKIINKDLINYRLEIKTINDFQVFYVIVSKIKNEFVLQTIIYYIFKNYLLKKNANKRHYIKIFLIKMKEYYNKEKTLENIILKEINYRLNRIQIRDILDKLDNPHLNIERDLIDINHDLKINYYYTDLLIIKTNNDSLIRSLIKVLYFDYIQVINPDFNSYDIKSQLKFICDLYQAILSNYELILNHSFKQRLISVVELVISILENPRDNVKNKLKELEKKKGIPLIYMFYNLVNGILDKEIIVIMLVLFIKSRNFIDRYNPDFLYLKNEETIEILKEANILDDTVFRNMDSRKIYELLLNQDDISELKKILMKLVYHKYIKKELNNNGVIRIIKQIKDITDDIYSNINVSQSS
jgi:hypothetical protein